MARWPHIPRYFVAFDENAPFVQLKRNCINCLRFLNAISKEILESKSVEEATNIINNLLFEQFDENEWFSLIEEHGWTDTDPRVTQEFCRRYELACTEVHNIADEVVKALFRIIKGLIINGL